MAHAPAVPIEELFVRSGALRDGHFLLKSGRHSGRYLEKFLVLQYPDLAVEIGRRFAALLAPLDPTLVVGPTTGGILTTGASVLETAGAVREAGAEPLAAAVIVDRSAAPVVAGFPIHALGRIEIDSWPADGCPLCASGLPLEKPGSS